MTKDVLELRDDSKKITMGMGVKDFVFYANQI